MADSAQPVDGYEVLEKLAQQHPLPNEIIEYRNVAKLKSTYLDTLPLLLAQDGRVLVMLDRRLCCAEKACSVEENLSRI